MEKNEEIDELILAWDNVAKALTRLQFILYECDKRISGLKATRQRENKPKE